MNIRLNNLLLLNFVFGPGSKRALQIYNELCDGGYIDMPLQDAVRHIYVEIDIKEKILSVKSSTVADIVNKCKTGGIDIIPIYSEKYPDCLRNIAVPPLVLYVKGKFPDFDNYPVFCIVGPRKITEFGKKASYSLARRLARAGMIIVAGAADGGDYAVHTGTLSAGGQCVMVSTDGIILQTNSKNRDLCEKILKNGCIISEAPPERRAPKYYFPIRNRIMSGLSLGVAVVEAPEVSGTLITATHAAEQGKDVFVIPGNPVDKEHKGSNALLRDGAIPLLDTSDIFSRYIIDFPEKIDIEKAYSDKGKEELKKNPQKKSISTLSKEAQLVYNNLDKHEFTIDDLSSLQIASGAILSAVTELEMEHLIESLPGGTYKIID